MFGYNSPIWFLTFSQFTNLILPALSSANLPPQKRLSASLAYLGFFLWSLGLSLFCLWISFTKLRYSHATVIHFRASVPNRRFGNKSKLLLCVFFNDLTTSTKRLKLLFFYKLVNEDIMLSSTRKSVYYEIIIGSWVLLSIPFAKKSTLLSYSSCMHSAPL